MRRIGFAVLLSIVALSLAAGRAQQPGTPVPGMPTPGQVTPPRGVRPGQEPLKGTATLRGYVVAADTGNPVRRAMVRAFSTSGAGGGGVTSTDADGRFEIRDLPAGSYNVTVSKAGYVTMQYGQRRPNQGGGTLIDVRDGQLAEKIAFALPRGGVITGKVTDEFGDAVAGAQVSALQYRYMGSSGRRLAPSGGATTDDLGNYRLFGLAPGEYFVSGVMRTPMMMGGPGMTATAAEGYAPTYYPGTTSPVQGQRVTVRAAQETTNVSFALSVTQLASISGRVLSSTNEPVVQAMVRVTPADRAEAMMGMMMNGSMTRADGSFQIAGVAPGNYTVNVMPRNFNDPSSGEFGQARVTVGADNVENLLIITSRGATLRGSIVTDDQTPLPVRPQQINVFARPSEPEFMVMGGLPPRVHDDFSFEIGGLADRRIIGASVAESPDWQVKAVYQNGVDVTDAGLEFTPGQDVEGVQIVFTNRRTELTGAITDERGRPSLDATVVAFSQDSRRWTFGSRYVRTARTTQDGRYSVRGLPPDDYFLAVVKEIEPGQWQDPEFLETLRDAALRITLGEGESRAQDLRVAQ